MSKIISILSFCLIAVVAMSMRHANSESNEDMLSKINKVRAQGCNCGWRYMEPVPPLVWSDELVKSAMNHAKDMDKNNFFGHFSSSGKDIGQRIDDINYKWKFVGENLGEGQTDFDAALQDWLKSKSHCRMLMNPNMKEMAVVHYKKYWVQHFASR